MTPCIMWTGKQQLNGYGIVGYDRQGNKILAHRLAWSQANERDIPPGMHICHTCDNPPCMNPEHLWLGTASDNAKDMVAKGRANLHQTRKTHCPQGHEYTEENTYRPPNRVERQCRTCVRERALARYHARKH